MKSSSDPPPDSLVAGDEFDWLTNWGGDFDLPDDRWMARLRVAERPIVLGRIGEYELEGEVERGGQGIVFRARQPGTKRRIALKRMLAGAFATEGMRRRFEREVEAAALLNHPNIVTVYGMDSVDGTPLLAMEWIDGVPATDWARGRAPEEILELFLRLCDAMQHAHSRGVLHRDIKPSNVLVDANSQPHVLDFGLAKRCPLGGGAGGDVLDVSKSADVFGTPAYASPEQLSGTETRLDASTDVYSLGVLLFEMLTDASPYGDYDGVADLLRRVGQTRPPRLATYDPRLSNELDTIVRAALEPARQDRTASVEDFASDIRRYLSGAPIHAVPLSSLTLLRRLVEKNPLVAGLGAALFVLSLAFGIFASVQARRFEQQTIRAENALEQAIQRERRVASLLAFIPDCVHVMNSGISPLIAKPGTVLDHSVSHSSPNPYFAIEQPELRAPAEKTATEAETRP